MHQTKDVGLTYTQCNVLILLQWAVLSREGVEANALKAEVNSDTNKSHTDM